MIQDDNTGHWKPNFGNFSTSTNIPQRSREKHRNIAYKFKKANSQIRNQILNEHGIRWTPLIRLPYMDIQRFIVIDPMHNLYLGTAKRMMKEWTSGDQPLISIHDLKKIQDIIDTTPPPSDIGCIPLNCIPICWIYCRSVENLVFILFNISITGYSSRRTSIILAIFC